MSTASDALQDAQKKSCLMVEVGSANGHDTHSVAFSGSNLYVIFHCKYPLRRRSGVSFVHVRIMVTLCSRRTRRQRDECYILGDGHFV